MADCGPLPLLPEDLSTMKVEAALKELLRVKLAGDEVYWNCVLRHNELVRWINDQ